MTHPVCYLVPHLYISNKFTAFRTESTIDFKCLKILKEEQNFQNIF